LELRQGRKKEHVAEEDTELTAMGKQRKKGTKKRYPSTIHLK
jgi:hypothetical protein